MSGLRVFFGALDVDTAAKIATAISQWQRRRRADGLPPDPSVEVFARALVSAYGGPAGTPLDAPPTALDAEAMNQEPRLLAYDETAARLRLSERQVKRLVSSRALRAVRIGAATRVHTADLAEFMESLRESELA